MRRRSQCPRVWHWRIVLRGILGKMPSVRSLGTSMTQYCNTEASPAHTCPRTSFPQYQVLRSGGGGDLEQRRLPLTAIPSWPFGDLPTERPNVCCDGLDVARSARRRPRQGGTSQRARGR